VNKLTIVPVSEIIPWSTADLAKAGTNLAQALLFVAEKTLEQDSPDFRKDYTGAERDAMVSQRALKLHNLMELAMDAAGQELVESLQENGAFHPDLRGDSQELVDELLTKGDQYKRRQGWYIVNVVFPKAKELGINVEAWKEETSYAKLRELTADFRFILEDKEVSESEREDVFLNLVGLSTKRVTEIREARMLRGPSEFTVAEQKREDGYEWRIPWLSADTRDWALRKLQPWVKREKI